MIDATQLLAWAIAHWPFVAATAIFALVGQVMKTGPLSKRQAAGDRLIWWLRATMPLHPIAAGVLLGLVPGVPVGPGVTTVAARCLYFAAAGMASAYFFALVKRVGLHWLVAHGLVRHDVVPHPRDRP